MLPQKSTDILSSIERTGLKSGNTTECDHSILGALTGQEETTFCYNRLTLSGSSPATIHKALKSLAYQSEAGLFAIATERTVNRDANLIEHFSRAALNSVVFIFCPPNRTTTNSRSLPQYDENMFGTEANHFSKDSYFCEDRVRGGQIPTENIIALLAPYHLYAKVKKIFFRTHVIPVSASEETFCENPITLTIMPGNKQTVVNSTIVAPNYLRALKSVLAEYPGLAEIGVHLTRLPLEEPIEIFSMAKAYNDSYMKLSRLINLKPEQLHVLKNHPQFTLVKENRDSPNYFCYYRDTDTKILKLYVDNFDKAEKAARIIQNRFSLFKKSIPITAITDDARNNYSIKRVEPG